MNMLTTRAKVVATKHLTASVSVQQVSGCEQCNGKGCGSSKVAQLFCQQNATFEVVNLVNAQQGDEVLISVQEGALLRGITVLYLMPLCALVIGAVVASYSLHSEFWVAIGAILGLLLGFFGVKLVAARLTPQQPYIQQVI